MSSSPSPPPRSRKNEKKLTKRRRVSSSSQSSSRSPSPAPNTGRRGSVKIMARRRGRTSIDSSRSSSPTVRPRGKKPAGRRGPKLTAKFSLCDQLLEELINHEDSWPFLEPVDLSGVSLRLAKYGSFFFFRFLFSFFFSRIVWPLPSPSCLGEQFPSLSVLNCDPLIQISLYL